MKRAIINADDFGLCRGVNEGIVLAHRNGVLTSTTLLANMPGFDQAVDLALQNDNLGVGIHLNFVRGRPVAPPDQVRTLLNDEKKFLSSTSLLFKRLTSRKIDLREVEREYRAQVEKVLQTNIKISHFDSEKHTHVHPSLMKIVVKLAADYNIKKIRFINEFCLSLRLSQSIKSFLASASCAVSRKQIESHGIQITDKFYGLCASGRMTAPLLIKILSKLSNGTTEIMVHPGFWTQEMIELEKEFGPYYIHKSRETELEALLDRRVKQFIQDQNIQMVNFHHL